MQPAKSMPALPSLTEAWQKQSNYLKMANEDRLSRSDAFVKQAREENARLSNFRSLQRSSIEKSRKQEKVAQIQRMRATTSERETRWGQKLADHPFSRDLWKEDAKIYDLNRAKDDKEQKRRKDTLQREIEDRGNQIKQKCSEVDELDSLRKERKCLLENYKVLKTRLEMEKKNNKSGAAQTQTSQPQVPAQATPETAKSRSFFISPAHHGAVTCRPHEQLVPSSEDIARTTRTEMEAVCPLEESAGEYYTKWSSETGEKSQAAVQGDKDCIDTIDSNDVADRSTTPKDEVVVDVQPQSA